MLRSMLFATMVLIATPVAAQTAPIPLKPGEKLTLRVDESGATLVAREPVTPRPRDLKVAANIGGREPPKEDLLTAESLDVDGKREPIVPGVVTIRAYALDGHTMMVVENGQDRAVRYRAKVVAQGKATATTVCDLIPGAPSFEYWHEPFDGFVLSDFAFVAYDGGVPPCA